MDGQHSFLTLMSELSYWILLDIYEMICLSHFHFNASSMTRLVIFTWSSCISSGSFMPTPITLLQNEVTDQTVQECITLY